MSVKCKEINEFMALELELYVYHLARVYCEDYQGGRWEFDTNLGCWFPLLESMYITNADNFFEGKLSSKQVGLALSMMACSHLSFKHYETHPSLSEAWGEQYYFLRDYVLNNLSDVEAGKILSFLD